METFRPQWQGQRALSAVCVSAIAALGDPVLAQQQDTVPVVTLGKVTITGSHIPRPELETALPVQIITREDIERTGSTTVAELVAKLSANVQGFNDQVSVGNSDWPGLSSVNLRGLGDGSTLVLLNGRRVANYAFHGSAVDVNSIPLSAVDRVEILKDGASAIYGTDAIAGVVNFILRKDVSGVEVTGFASRTQHGGGDQRQATATAGVGTLAKDKYNLFVTATYQKDDALDAAQRPFARTGYLPSGGLIQLPPTTFPANIYSPVLRRLFNPFYASGCAPPLSLPATSAATPGDACGFDEASVAGLIPAVERLAAYARATLQVSANDRMFAEGAYASNRMRSSSEPTPVAPFALPGNEPIRYPASGPYYPTAFAAANGISGDIDLIYRTVPLGSRLSQIDTSASRAVIGAEGDVAGWRYDTALNYSRTDESQTFVSGYVSARRIIDAMATGLVNPFGASGPEGNALLTGAQVSGEARFAKGTTIAFDLKGSRDVYALSGGPLSIALGVEARREQLDNGFAPFVASGDLVGIRFAQQSVSGSRSAKALFAEAGAPIAKGVEAQLAARYDRYSDFGGTTNPKVALRWQPVKSVLLRTSWGTGFRAPPLYDLYTPQSRFDLVDQIDPVRCPVTGADRDCRGNFTAVVGGNPDLKPETSEQFNAGVVWEPVGGLSVAVDYWKINQSNVIAALDQETIFGDFSRYAPTNIVRGPVDRGDLPGPIELVVLTRQNIGNVRTSGIDIDVRWRGRPSAIGRFSFSLNATYLHEWKIQPDGSTYVSGAGRFLWPIGPFARWRHYASLGWDDGHWAATLAQTYQSGYEDLNDFERIAAPPPARRVSSYELWDVQGRYTGFRHVRLVLGIKNLFDRDPPFTNQHLSRQLGYDPQYADPRGRSFYASLTYAFK